MILNLTNISKKYETNIILRHFDYTFNEGLYLLIGRNGSGKSTLLKIISGLIYPTNSNYIINNVKVAYLCEKNELGNGNIFVFLNSINDLFKSKRNIKEELKKWDIPNKNINKLSKGNKQKSAIIMMSLVDADVYIFDEPTDALDTKSIGLFIDLISELINNKKTIIISTHEKKYFERLKYTEVNFS